jgi:threonine aldolase
MAAEAVVVFNSDRAAGLARRHKRAGHLFSKMRFMSVQLETYLKDDLWLQLAERANRAADALSAGLGRLAGVEVLYPVEANEVFVKMPPPLADSLKEAGYEFHLWPGSRDHYRLVACFATRADEVNAFLALARKLSDGLEG